MAPIQILIVIFALFALSRSILRWKDHSIRFQELVFWAILWGFIILTMFIPKTTTLFSSLLGFSSGANIAVYISIILLFYLVFRIYVQIEKTNKDLTKLVRALAKEKKK